MIRFSCCVSNYSRGSSTNPFLSGTHHTKRGGIFWRYTREIYCKSPLSAM